MSNASNQLSIYLIVVMNAVCHMLLIWRLKMDKIDRLKFCGLTIAIPLLVMAAMRLTVAIGLMHSRVAEQGGVERFLTMLASMLLIAGPFMATGAALVCNRKKRILAMQPQSFT